MPPKATTARGWGQAAHIALSEEFVITLDAMAVMPASAGKAARRRLRDVSTSDKRVGSTFGYRGEREAQLDRCGGLERRDRNQRYRQAENRFAAWVWQAFDMLRRNQIGDQRKSRHGQRIDLQNAHAARLDQPGDRSRRAHQNGVALTP